MTARDLFLSGRQWTRVEVRVYEQNDARGHMDKELGAEHGQRAAGPAQPMTYETFETRSYVLTHLPSHNAKAPTKEPARWNISFDEDFSSEAEDADAA